MCKNTVIGINDAPTGTSKTYHPQRLSFRYFMAFVPFILVLLISTSYQHKHDDVNYFERDDFAPEVKDSLRNFIAAVKTCCNVDPLSNEWDFIKGFYSDNGYRPIWIHLNGLDDGTEQLIQLIEKSREFGLNPDNYHIQSIRNRINAYQNIQARVYMDFALEVTLTDAAFRLMFNLHSGYLPYDSAFSSGIADEFASILLRSVAENNVYAGIVSAEPQFYEYQKLRQATAVFLTENELNYAEITDSSTLIEREFRFNRLALNLDRLRKQTYNPERMIYVNIPSYTLRIFEKNQIADTFRVIVGNPATPTPVLSGTMQSIIANPEWFVPKSIALNEILPKLKSDTTYLQKHGYSVLDVRLRVVDAASINFSNIKTSDFNYTFRQKRGSANSLGTAKFLFDNPYAVYLHDTPSRALFAKQKRALSHGCVRLQHPERLANYILRNINSDTTHFEKVVETGLHSEFRLKSDLPVHITYITCEATGNGRIVFYDDIYNYDRTEIEAMLQFIKAN